MMIVQRGEHGFLRCLRYKTDRDRIVQNKRLVEELVRRSERRGPQHGPARRGQGHARHPCALIPAKRMTFAHFSISSARKRLNSAAEQPSTTAPIAAKCALTVASLRAALISRSSMSITACGVPAGAPMPCHDVAS